MTVETQVKKVGPVEGNGVATTFSFSPMIIFESGNLVVTFTDVNGVETVLTEGTGATNYSVGITIYPATGSITYPASGTDILAAGEFITIKRVLTIEQQTALDNQGGYFPSTQEAQFDKCIIIDLQQQEEIDRSIKLPVSFTGAVGDAEISNTELAADLYLKTNATADGFELAAISVASASASSSTPSNVSLTAAAAGAGANFSRSDHVHLLSVSANVKTILEAANNAAVLTALGFSSYIQGLVDDTTSAAARTTLIVPEGYTMVPGGRLTLTSATPITTADVTAATTIYYALDTHDWVPLWDGSAWSLKQFTELSLALDNNAGHTGYHQSGKNFDLFVYNDAGTIRLCSGPAWTNDTTRADAIGRKNGRWTNNASIVLRFGSAVGNTVTAAANTALWVGGFRASANGQTEDSYAKRFLSQNYAKARRPMRVTDGTDSWAYTSATVRQARATATNQIEFFLCSADILVDAEVLGIMSNSNSVSMGVAIGLDSTTTIATDSTAIPGSGDTGVIPQGTSARYSGFPGLGYHTLVWLEYSNASAVSGLFYGDNGLPGSMKSGISGMFTG